jgi:hypothetical protein
MNPPDCYDPFDSGELPIMLRVEAGEKWGFPLAQILHVHQEAGELAITFATHDLKIRGKALEILHKEICRSRVAVVRVGESSDGVTITAIEVKECGQPNP